MAGRFFTLYRTATMNESITVHVVDYGRSNLYMRYTDPITGKQIAKSTGTKKKAEAVKVAAKWEAELQEGRYKSPSKVTWSEFTERYDQEVLQSLAPKTSAKAWSTFSAIEKHINPRLLANLTSERISHLQKCLRDQGLSEHTIKSHSAHLKAALNWAKGVEMLHQVPKITMPQRAKSAKVMKGRPVTAEEFDRMIDKTTEVVGPKRAPHWQRFLRGLWWSGLRISEAINLTWDGDGIRAELVDEFFMLRISADSHKANVDQLLPLAPEFIEMLRSTPVEERTGYVFTIPMKRGNGRRTDTISKTIIRIGEAARVKVDSGIRNGEEFTKWAGAHDLRRSFGTRWAPRVMPVDLQKLMRHEKIETTLKFYVSNDAKSLTERLYASVGNTSGNTKENAASRTESETLQSVASDGLFELPE